ncbi:hypothetical protein B0A48_10964 [Cryoendolithus antarcticus]|uniref:tripeptidyl-peptidase II n=1 Tax=Cryoendolithus antarcticus TaxID=1507870 RepID=A0A1V8SYX1_9PEZI|nr:hypothetical protein B0A48_10964 [Cryoendolithus antarcticus]
MKISYGLLAGLVGASATATSDVMESLTSVPQGWTSIGRPSSNQRVHFRIAMSSPNEGLGLFEQTLYDISTPEHASYGKHLKRDELKALLRPHPAATESVVTWLQSAGIDDIVDDGEWINFVTVVDKAESLLNTKFEVYRNKYSKQDKIRTLHYSVPEQLHQFIDMVQPTTRFGQIKPQMNQVIDVHVIGAAGTGLNVTACNATITPDCLKDLYGIPETPDLNPKKSGFAAFNNFLGEIPRFKDLATFEAEYAPYAVGTTFATQSINGGPFDQNSTEDSVEANLDAQYILSIGYPVPIKAYSTPGLGPLLPDLDQPEGPGQNEPYLDALTYLLAQPDRALPHTISTSYGEDEQSVPLAYRKKVCNMFGQLGARGVSVLFSSGDTGVGSACQTNDGKNTTRFLPIFPAACPYLTSVGGTYRVKPERAISFSSGGFSDTWPTPAYQKTAVRRYLNNLGSRWQGLYNPGGRGFPDVAAQSYRFHVVDKQKEILVGGTSASSPAFAGIVALLNAYRLKAGKPVLGFLNPWIYSEGYKGLTDIVDGGSTGCTGKDIYSGLKTPFVPYASWNATPGWDPVTGYGTPNFPVLLKLATKGPKGHW